jgi:hypothetical protein
MQGHGLPCPSVPPSRDCIPAGLFFLHPSAFILSCAGGQMAVTSLRSGTRQCVLLLPPSREQLTAVVALPSGNGAGHRALFILARGRPESQSQSETPFSFPPFSFFVAAAAFLACPATFCPPLSLSRAAMARQSYHCYRRPPTVCGARSWRLPQPYISAGVGAEKHPPSA